MAVAAAATPYLIATSLAATAASGAISYMGAQQSAAAQEQATNYQSAVAQNNAQIAKINAQNAENAGETQAENQLLQAGQQTAAVRAAAAANGLDANSGTPVNLQSDTEKLGTEDALTTRNQADWQAYGYQVGANSDVAQSQLDIAQGQEAQVAGTYNSVGDLLSTASNVSSKWSMYQLSAAKNNGSNPNGLGTGL